MTAPAPRARWHADRSACRKRMKSCAFCRSGLRARGGQNLAGRHAPPRNALAVAGPLALQSTSYPQLTHNKRPGSPIVKPEDWQRLEESADQLENDWRKNGTANLTVYLPPAGDPL